MKRIAFLAAITLFALAFLSVLVNGQDSSPTATVTVRGSEVVTGVVIVSAQITSADGRHASVELQCNKGVSMCNVPRAGTYLLVQLPKNRGTYDCVNVELYPQGTDPETSEDGKIGAYCLIQK